MFFRPVFFAYQHLQTVSPYLEFAHIKLILDTLLNLQFFLIMLNWYRLKFAHWGGKGKSKTGANTM